MREWLILRPTWFAGVDTLKLNPPGEKPMSVIATFKEPETAAELSQTVRMLLADRLDVVGLPRPPVESEARVLEGGDVFKDEDAEVFEVALDNDVELAVIVVPVGTWYDWRKKIQGR